MEKDSEVIWILLLKYISFIIRAKREKGHSGDPASNQYLRQIRTHCESRLTGHRAGWWCVWTELMFREAWDLHSGWKILSFFQGDRDFMDLSSRAEVKGTGAVWQDGVLWGD